MSDPSDPFHEGADAARSRRRRSLGIMLALLALVLLTFAVTMLRLGAHAPA